MNRSGKGMRLGIVAGLVVILAGFSYLIYGGLGENLVYFVSPTELYAKGDGAWDTPVRLGGQVVPGSVVWNAEALDLRFRISDGEHEMTVRSRGAPPQMFRDGIGVVVEGRLVSGGDTFESTNLMVKHSNEYRAPDDATHPKELYQTLMKD